MNKEFIYYEPITAVIPVPPITMDELFNPLYPCHLKWRCKATRKKFRK